MTTEQLAPLFKKLRAFGFDRLYIERILPEWWDDSAAESPSALMELKLQLARSLSLDPKTVLEDEAELAFRQNVPAAFKASRSKVGQPLQAARAVAEAAARVAVEGCRTSYRPPAAADEVRDTALADGHPWISFEVLLDYCWSVGIPVIHVTDLPGHKMDGMVAIINGQPAIVLALDKRRSAWLLFTLAHELGHIACNHLDEEIVDVHVVRNSKDPREVDANRYALMLLTGGATRYVNSSKTRSLSGAALAVSARQIAHERKVDPGHIVLNYADSETTRGADPGKTWGAANNALKELGDPDPRPLVKKHIDKYFDPDAVSDDSYDFFRKVTGME